jgi:prepilin-type N-terminal cleavage/methylation domain-containing protein
VTRSARRGMSLVEIMVVLALVVTLFAVLAGGLRGIFGLEHHKAAVRLATLYQQLHDEAQMKNVTFRVVFDLGTNEFHVEVGEGAALIFDDPEKKAEWEEAERRKVALMDERELAEYKTREQPFDKLGARFQTEFHLPSGLKIAGIYTPQYGRMMTLDDLEQMAAESDDGVPPKIYSYVFPNGMSEHTIIWLREGDSDDGWSVEVEPLSGNVTLHETLVPWQDAFSWVPDEGPELEQ